MGSMLEAALRYAALGYPVFPCVRGEKRPLTPNGLLDATTDPQQIRRWWTARPAANLAIRTDGLLVVDVDDAAPAGFEQRPGFDAAPLARTPRGGRHYIFRQPDGTTLHNSQGRLAPHVDTRATGGYILVAPSVVGGRSYRWERGLAAGPSALPEPPAWLVGALASGLGAAHRSRPGAPHRRPSEDREDAINAVLVERFRAGVARLEAGLPAW